LRKTARLAVAARREALAPALLCSCIVMNDELILGMAGAGGDGVVTSGEMLLGAAAHLGYHGILTKSFGPQIRGGESSCRLRLSVRPVHSSGGTLDLALALNWDDFLKFGAELPVSGRTTVVYDSASGVAPTRLPLVGVVPAEAVAVPIAELARRTAGTDKAKNAVVLGMLAGWLGLSAEVLLARLRAKLAKKGEAVVAANQRAFESGLDYALERPLATRQPLAPPPGDGAANLLADGNEMCAAAALFAGCQFFGGYPITPSSEIMQLLSREIWKHGGVMLQAEDEIAGVGAAIGASFAGRKAMTATSGPGMSLKTELLGLATIAELPLVCVNVQRGGPSTGMPTKSEQADLFQALFSAHGDAPRPVLAPTCVADTFSVTVEAFNVAEQLQTPVIVLSDQDIAQRKQTVQPFDTSALPVVERRRPNELELAAYRRFEATESGVSPISEPGMTGGSYLASGIEHDERGAPTASGEVHARMIEKRLAKLDPLKDRRDLFTVEGDPQAPLALVSWGSTAGVALEALRQAQAEGLRVKLLVPRLLYPVAERVYAEFFASVQAGYVVEQSQQGQLYRVLRMFVDVPPGVRSFARSGANPISPAELLEALRQAQQQLQRRQAPRLEPRE
jgi:2-oxoglutarate ferredoxin oxidoreductase subunit alpha